MKIWTLILIYGISSWGVGGIRHTEYPDKDSCFEALETMVKTDNMVAYCKYGEAK